MQYFRGLEAWCHSFLLYWFFFHTYNTFTHSYIHKHSPRLLSIPSSLNSSVANTSLGRRAGIRTRARLTASRRATKRPTSHPNESRRTLWATSHPKAKSTNTTCPKISSILFVFTKIAVIYHITIQLMLPFSVLKLGFDHKNTFIRQVEHIYRRVTWASVLTLGIFYCALTKYQ